MTAPAFPDGIDAAVWEEVNPRSREFLSIPADVLLHFGRRYFVRREPTPTMPALPAEPATIRVTTATRTVDGRWDGRKWVSSSPDTAAVRVEEILSWEPLVTRSDVLEQLDVERLRNRRDSIRCIHDPRDRSQAYADEVDALLARVDGADQ